MSPTKRRALLVSARARRGSTVARDIYDFVRALIALPQLAARIQDETACQIVGANQTENLRLQYLQRFTGAKQVFALLIIIEGDKARGQQPRRRDATTQTRNPTTAA